MRITAIIMRGIAVLLSVCRCCSLNAQPTVKLAEATIGNDLYHLSWQNKHASSFSYLLKGNKKPVSIAFPSFEINGRNTAILLDNLHLAAPPVALINQVQVFTCEGTLVNNSSIRVQMDFAVAPGNPVLRFRYRLRSDDSAALTRNGHRDRITYLAFHVPQEQAKEVSFSKFDERFHATHLSEQTIDGRFFEDSLNCMGPMLVANDAGMTYLVAYEHGSPYGNRFLQYQFNEKGNVRLEALKGNYLNGEKVNDFTTLWFELAAVNGNENLLADNYRTFVLDFLSVNKESRKPYIFYNTWGRQERVQWRGGKYLSSMNLQETLKEIDRAHQMGIEVYVIDAGWFNLTGDWDVNTRFFPDSLKQVKKRLDDYGMKLGLWFNPTVAAVKSRMYAANTGNRISWNDSFPPPSPVWETPTSTGLCMVSSYWNDFAAKLIELNRQLGVTYFKWDGIGQYGCNDAHHY
ncbi:MAG: alpha-galactosidase, partial [Chitinophagaceae bacterium]|nr:alpha-galactosidase [Chitinophagaceae bacterium]